MEQRLSRRQLLRLGSAGGALLLAGTGELGRVWTGLARALSPNGIADANAATLACVLTPAKTEGPYFVDERLNRSDIRTDPGTGSVEQGITLRLKVSVFDAERSCAPVQGAVVDIWHANAAGAYSDIAGAAGRKFLRGYQTTDASGAAEFVTVYPGWYAGRAIHIHLKARTFDGLNKTYEFTSQIFFEESVNAAVATRAPYSSRGAADTPNSRDNIYGSDGSQLLATTAADGSGGYTGTFAVGLTGLPAGTAAADTKVGASVVSARVSRAASGRVLKVTLDLDEKVSADLRLLRAGHTLAHKRFASLAAGVRRPTLAIPRTVAAGGARLHLTLGDAAGNQKVVQRAVTIPAR